MKKMCRLKVLIALYFLCSIQIVSAQYCIPKTTYKPSLYNMYIDSVSLQDINYQDSATPADTCYNDNTQAYGGQTLLTRGTTYTMTIKGGPYYSYMYYAAWIDYNNDKDFIDPGEKLGEFKTTVTNQKFTISFTVPAGATVSTTRLRVRCGYNNVNMDPCALYYYGETEDYAVTICDFVKVGTGITGIGMGELAFFNNNTDNDYDLIMQDELSTTVPVRFYNNTAGVFSQFNYLNGGLPEPDNDNMSFNFCDLNNDNALDILFTYRYNSSLPRTVYFQKSGSLLNQVSTGIPNLMRGSSATADFNNDGRQDIVICGIGADNLPHTYIYMNTPTGFVLVNDKLKGLYGQVLAADYDNDKDIDIFISGIDKYGNTNSIIYRNDNNWQFTNILANLNKVGWLDRSEFGDFNNDGRLDIIIGNKIYRNDGNNIFTGIYLESSEGLYDSGHWKDINNDGILELISQNYYGVTIHKFNGADAFLLDQQLFVKGDNLAIGDYNNDNKQDIIINHYPEAYILRNQTPVANQVPSAPTKFNTLVGDSGFYSVTLKWNRGTDDVTPPAGLSYNLRVGTTSGGNDILSSMTSPADNSLLYPGLGNVYTNTSWYLKNLKPGKYYWSVQSIDNSGLASAFSSEQQFAILAPLTPSSFLAQGYISAAGAGADFNGDSDVDLIIRDSVLAIYDQLSPNNYSYHKVGRNCSILDIKDLNNDNLPDIIAKHNKIQGVEQYDSLTLFINKGNYVFKVINLDTLSVSSVAAADFDNDGDIDILVHDRGYYFYENTGSLQFKRTKLPFTEVLDKTSLSAIDIDRDNKMDFIISGLENGPHTYIYKNTGNKNFILSQSIIPAIGPSKFGITSFVQSTIPADIVWNDYNFDGYPDLLITGNDAFNNNTNQIFLNDGTGKLVLTTLSPRPVNKYGASWIDFNTDGYLDLIIPKVGFNIDNTIYLNDHNSGYTGFPNCVDSLTSAMYIKAIDVDNDKDKDIICTYKVPVGVDGYRNETKIYINNNNFVNQPPYPPSSITHEIDSFTVILKWNKGQDALTGSEGHTYNLWVGTVNNKADIVSPLADLNTGYRFVENIGNVGTNLSWTLKNLPLGKYFWSVQTIDNSLQGSSWAPVSSFEISALTADFINDVVCLGFDTHFSDNSVSTSPVLTWRWDFGDGNYSSLKNPVFRFTKAGNNPVKLVVTSATSRDSVTKNVIVKAIPNSDFTANVVCAGNPTNYTNSTINNGLTISGWHWDFGDGSGSNVQNPGTHGYLVPGSYNVILVAVADNGCSDTIRKSVLVGSIPTAAITSSGSTTFCSGDSIILTNSLISSFSYSWQIGGVDITGANQNRYAAKQSGSYTVKVINPTGNCTSISNPVNVLVNEKPSQPVITLNGNPEFCTGDSVGLYVSLTNNLLYQWKLNGGTVGSNSNKFTARNAGTYNLVVSNSTGCSATSSNSVNVVVKSPPSVSAVSLSGPATFCSGGNITLSIPSTPGYSYSWRNETGLITGAISNSFMANKSGSYQVDISNSSGCIVRTQPVNVLVKPMPIKPVIDPGNYQTGKCMGENPIRLNVSQAVTGYNYQWYKNGIPISNATSSYYEAFLSQGDYSLEADLSGCKVQSDLLNVYFENAPEKPLIYAEGSNIWYLACSNDSASQYKWYYNGALIQGADKYIYVANRKLGRYNVSIANAKGCFTISDPITIPTGTTGIDDVDPFAGLRIYPNPTPGLFTIEMENQLFGDILINILTQDGKSILRIKFEKTTAHFSSQIDLSGQPKGLYLINIILDKYFKNNKIIIE
jgi:PKD repeat protein